MSDFESFRREAGNQVLPPDFDDLLATSRRRRRTAAATAVVAVAAAVSVVAFGLQGVYGDQTAPAHPIGPTLDPTSGPVAPDCASARPADLAVKAAAGATVSVFFTCAATVAEVPTPVYAVDRSVPADMTERDRVAFVVGEYLRGPSPEEAKDGYLGGLPGIVAAALDDVSLQDGVVTVDFLPSADEALGAFTSTESLAFQSALAAGVFQFPSAQKLRVTIAGNCDEFWRHLEMTCQTMSAPTPSLTKDTSPSPEERPDRLTPTQIVNDENSTISDVAVSASSPEVVAVIWQDCGEGGGCKDQQFALTVTGDGFKTSHDIALPGRVWPDMHAIGNDLFYVAVQQNGWIVHSDGRVSEVHLEQAVRPVAAGEVFVQAQPTGTPDQYLALDPATAVAHPIPIPDMYTRSGSVQQNPNGTLIGVVYNWAGTFKRWVIWSHDGGATWSKHLLVEGSDLVDVIDSASPNDVMAVVQGGDGATLFPFDTVHRSTDGGATWQTFDESPGDMAYLGWTLITPDGSLLVNIEGWSDERRGRPSSHPEGLYQSNGSDWADMRYVQDLPASSEPRFFASGFTLGDYATTDSGVLRLWIYEYAGNRMFESGPGIHTWAEVPAR